MRAVAVREAWSAASAGWAVDSRSAASWFQGFWIVAGIISALASRYFVVDGEVVAVVVGARW